MMASDLIVYDASQGQDPADHVAEDELAEKKVWDYSHSLQVADWGVIAQSHCRNGCCNKIIHNDVLFTVALILETGHIFLEDIFEKVLSIAQCLIVGIDIL